MYLDRYLLFLDTIIFLLFLVVLILEFVVNIMSLIRCENIKRNLFLMGLSAFSGFALTSQKALSCASELVLSEGASMSSSRSSASSSEAADSVNLSTYSLNDILSVLQNQDNLEKVIRYFNPSAILSSVRKDLKGLKSKMPRGRKGKALSQWCSKVQELFLKGLFAISFHNQMCLEVHSQTIPFFEEISAMKRGNGANSISFQFLKGYERIVQKHQVRLCKQIIEGAEKEPEKCARLLLIEQLFFPADKGTRIKKSFISFKISMMRIFDVESPKSAAIFSAPLYCKGDLALSYALNFGSKDAEHFCLVKAAAFQQRGNLENAIKYYKLAAEINNVYALEQLVLIFFKAENQEEYNYYSSRAISLGSKTISGLHDIGKAKAWFTHQTNKLILRSTNVMEQYAFLQSEGKIVESIDYLLKESASMRLLKRSTLQDLGEFKELSSEDKAYIAQSIESIQMEFLKVALEQSVKAGEIDKVLEVYRAFIDLRQYAFLLLTARRLNELGRFKEAEVYFKKAIGRGVEKADCHYIEFLRSQERTEELQAYLAADASSDEDGSRSGESSSGEGSDSHSGASSEEEDDSGEENSFVVDSRPASASDDTSSSSAAASPSSFGASSPSAWVKPLTRTEISRLSILSKKRKKHDARLAKEKPQKEITRGADLKTQKSYEDISVSCVSDAFQEIMEGDEMKVKQLISFLAQGELRRGKFERLTSEDGIYTMRINKGDRLAFTITDGNPHDGVTAITILAAKGHDTYTKRLDCMTTQEIHWEE